MVSWGANFAYAKMLSGWNITFCSASKFSNLANGHKSLTINEGYSTQSASISLGFRVFATVVGVKKYAALIAEGDNVVFAAILNCRIRSQAVKILVGFAVVYLGALFRIRCTFYHQLWQ